MTVGNEVYAYAVVSCVDYDSEDYLRVFLTRIEAERFCGLLQEYVAKAPSWMSSSDEDFRVSYDRRTDYFIQNPYYPGGAWVVPEDFYVKSIPLNYDWSKENN